MDDDILDYVIVGAGPAGLAFAGALERVLGTCAFRIVDEGKPVHERKHDDANDLCCGAGGAGLFSDGKFSYFPAGTNVWKLCYPLIERAHADLANVLRGSSFVPAAPTEDEVRDYFFSTEDHTWLLKKYPTLYMGLDERKRLIQQLVARVPESNILMQHEMVHIQHQPSEDAEHKWSHAVRVRNVQTGDETTLFTRCVVLAGGRFMPLRLGLPDRLPGVFRRYEFGVRIEASAGNPVMIGDDEFRAVLDPKWRYKENDCVEFRTFCWCRNGETVQSKAGGMRTYSGRSDCEPTQRSNFGFLVRITDPDGAVLTHEDFDAIARAEPFYLALGDVDDERLRTAFGQRVGRLLLDALAALVAKFPALRSADTRVFGPAIEGVGLYPDIDHNLRVRHMANMYCIGDCTGTFRGIVPCMVSGYYLAHSLALGQRNLTFVTGNASKAVETEQILGPLRIAALDLPELQGEPEDVARQKCRMAAEQIDGPVIVEDTSLCFTALGGMPGPYIRHFYERLGCEGLVRMLDGFEDKSASVKCIFAYAKSAADEPRLFVGTTNGTIVPPRGNRNFGWDPVFQPDGYVKTYAEMDDGAKNKISHRYRAIELLRRFLHNDSGKDQQST